jgi:hypothetical protein
MNSANTFYRKKSFRTLPLIAVALFSFFCQNIFAGTDSTFTKSNIKKGDYYIDDDQQRLDLLDGVADGKITLDDSATSMAATKLCFSTIDSIQKLIDLPRFDEVRKKAYRETVYLQMRRINARNIYNVKRFQTIFHFIQGELNAILDNKLYPYLVNNISLSFGTLGLIKNETCADSFLIFAAAYRPDLVFKNYDAYSNKNYTLHVLEEASKIAPVTVKRYFNPKDKIFETLKTSNDTVVKTLLEIKNKFSRKSNAFALLDGIICGNYSMEKADALGSSPQKYLRALLKIRAKNNPLAVRSLEDELEIYSLKFVRVLNDLHNEKEEKRFASIEDFSPEEIYTLMVYSEEEIFTSTFNGLFKRLMIKLGPVSGYEFLNRVGDNRFRTFIKMSAGFGKLPAFLQSMTAVHQQMLMIKFASGLDEYSDLSQAVEVADAFGSISDSLVLKILRGTIKYEYIKLHATQNLRGSVIYGLLSSLFVEKNMKGDKWFSSLTLQYASQNFDKVSNARLFDHDSINRWLIYFYDDEDGEASFTAFRKTFADSNWAIIDSGKYIIIQSKKGLPVHIYANKSKEEYEGQAALEKLFSDNGFEPNVMVHRGHSYYAFKTIEKIKENTQIFVLGSCGGYHSISSIIERSPDASIISSKQIGARAVNNPMLKLMADYIRTGKDIEWQYLWSDLEVSVKKDAKAYERFLDYIPPHKNLGAIFIKTYNRIMENE